MTYGQRTRKEVPLNRFQFALVQMDGSRWIVVSKHQTKESASRARENTKSVLVRTPAVTGSFLSTATVTRLLREMGDENGAPV